MGNTYSKQREGIPWGSLDDVPQLMAFSPGHHRCILCLCLPVSNGCDDLVAQLLLVKKNTQSVFYYGLWPVKLSNAGVVVLVLKLVSGN